MRKSMTAIVAASAAALAGCQVHAEENGGATVSRSYKVGNFQQIEVAGPYQVEVRTGAKPGVSARGSEKLLERTVVEVKGDKLIIHPEQRRGWLRMDWGMHGKAVFTVTVPQLSGATIAGSGGIKVDRIAGQSFEGMIAGSGGLILGATDVQSLKLTIGGSGGIKAGAGKAKVAEYEIAGSGGIQAQAIAAEQAKVSIAGSGSIQANATGTADVDIMGSGDVNITGGAKCNISKAGSGNVRCS